MISTTENKENIPLLQLKFAKKFNHVLNNQRINIYSRSIMCVIIFVILKFLHDIYVVNKNKSKTIINGEEEETTHDKRGK